MTRRAIWLPLALFAAVAVALTGVFANTDGGNAQVVASADVVVDDVTVVPGGTVTANITVTPTAGLIGAMDFEVAFDNTLAGAGNCSSTFGTCNEGAALPAGDTTPEQGADCGDTVDNDADTVVDDGCGPVIFALALVAGITGTAGTITFVAGPTEGLSALTLTLENCADETGEPATCTVTDGSLTIQAATPTPSPSPSPSPAPATASPTPTAAALPPTGGDSDGSSALPLLLAAMGVAALTAGAWAVTRLRRVRA